MAKNIAILGLNAFHGDASACLVVDGKLVAAVEEERFRRIKHWAGFPEQALRWCLDEAGACITDVDFLAVNSDDRANRWRKAAYMLTHNPRPRLVWEKLRNRRRRSSAVDRLRAMFELRNGIKTIHYPVEHHTAHLYSAFNVSPFDEAVTVSIDGFGDFSSAAWGVGRGDQLEVDGYVHFPHSLGAFYQAITQYLGFPNYGDEYKVMGLASYGEPAYIKPMRELLHADGSVYALGLPYFRHHRHEIGFEWDDGTPRVGTLYSERMAALLGPPRDPAEEISERHRDIAHSAQCIYEENLFRLLCALHERYRLNKIALAGGCAMNSVANGKIRANTPFEQVYVQPAAGDAGGALGAALVAWHEACGGRREFAMDHAYWGPQYDNAAIEAAIDGEADRLQGMRRRRFDNERDMCRHVAAKIADGQVVGWYQGRSEWGPRALGNRSILCDPRRADMKELLNRKIKRRESFRPFAPAILREEVSNWFSDDDDVPFMMKVYPVRPERRAQIPAVTHVDGTGRLQTVHRHTNPRFYRLIEEFQALTSVPVLLNTSFNENEPIINRPQEALDCFLRTGMDTLVLGDHVIERPQ